MPCHAVNNLGDRDLVDMGVAIAAAVLHEMNVRKQVPASGYSVQVWIPLERGVQAAFMNRPSAPEVIDQAEFEATLASMLAVQPKPVLTRVLHDDAKRIFAEQGCLLTVKRIKVLNHRSYECWQFGSYYGLLFPKETAIADAWTAMMRAHDLPATTGATATTAEDVGDVQQCSSCALTDLVDRITFVFPTLPRAGLLVAPRDGVCCPRDHMQVLRIAVDSYRATNLCGTCMPSVDAEYVAQSEMRFSRRVYDFASMFAKQHNVVQPPGDDQPHEQPRGSLLLVTGPSASGKTTFANRLSLALRAYGYGPLTVSMDEYYRDSHVDPNYPRNPDGSPNHELVDCLNLDALVDDIDALLKYEPVELPQFDMVHSKPKPKTNRNYVSLAKAGGKPLLIVEGIFALHPTFVKMLEQRKESFTKLFVMPIATVGVTELVTISNQTARLLRRISRDYLHRGRNARASIGRLPGVQKGEDEGIFPLLRHADYVFNTFIDYEVGLLSVYVAPLLRQIEPSDSAYHHGQLLLSILEGVEGVSDRTVQRDSLVREFIGGSLFDGDHHLSAKLDNRADQLLGKRFSFTKSSGSLMPMLHWHDANRSSPVPRTPAPRIIDELLRQLKADEDASASSDSADDKSDSDGVERRLSIKTEADLLDPSEVLAILNNRQVVSLNLPLEGSDFFHGADLRPLKMSSTEGIMAYDQTALLMLHVAVKQVLGHRRRLVVLHRFVEEGDRHCVRVEEGSSVLPLTIHNRDDIMQAFVALCADAETVHLRYVSPATAVEWFLQHHMTYSVRLLESCTRTKVLLAELAGIPALALKPLLPNTKHIEPALVRLEPTQDGVNAMVHHAPHQMAENAFDEWTFTVDKQHIPGSPELSCPLFESQRIPINTPAALEVTQSRQRASCAHGGVFCIGDVNNAIFAGRGSEIVSVDDALEFQLLYSILRRVENTNARILFVAGSSSSGKSVIAAQMRQLLEAHGYVTATMATDDYYRNLDEVDYPTFANGTKNTESVECLRLALFGEHLRRVVLLGENVTDGPMFDCGTGVVLPTKRFIRGLPANRKATLIVEGLFALSPAISALLGDNDRTPMLRVMVHPMPLLNLDELHLSSATRLRLLRRIVRDYNLRGRTAKTTLERRHFVQDGEVLNTLPFIEKADMIVNASCVYELSALRITCETLLNFVPDSLTDGADTVRCAMQLKELLSWICGMPDSRIPSRRFIQMLVDPEEVDK